MMVHNKMLQLEYSEKGCGVCVQPLLSGCKAIRLTCTCYLLSGPLSHALLLLLVGSHH